MASCRFFCRSALLFASIVSLGVDSSNEGTNGSDCEFFKSVAVFVLGESQDVDNDDIFLCDES
jgi:hypothetical protein